MATILTVAAMATFQAPRTLPGPQLAVAPVRRNVVSFAGRRPGRARGRLVVVAAGSPTPPELAQKVSESIKQAEETCAGDPEGGECAAAWDEVEELSAAASHARDRKKDSDPLEEYCKDNPETDECRTYDD
uniref:CP12 domain-containing protein n=1 Tax=Oryza punctata TaxID=4537 RepID=A0A0E0KCR9_ORYPU